MSTFAFPGIKDHLVLADWLELQALGAPDGNASAGDLERALRRTGLYAIPEEAEAELEVEAIEEMTRAVFGEVERRAAAAGDSYPFAVDVDRGLLSCRQPTPATKTYVFLLCLSYWDWAQPGGAAFNPRQTFENLSCLAVANYLNGRVARFAAPRDAVPASLADLIIRLPGGFQDAVNRLCELLAEGDGYRLQPTLHSQDDKLDVVAWKLFSDGEPGALVVFGQCASGRHQWWDKANELTPVLFCEDWMARVPATRLHKAFFIPHRVDRQRWERACRHGGLFFERCRLSDWATRVPIDPAELEAWTNHVMAANAEPPPLIRET